MRERTSENYKFTLAVQEGEILDPLECLSAARTFTRRANVLIGTGAVRLVVDLKFRGPRLGNEYRTPRDAAYAVDVYLRRRVDRTRRAR